MTNLLAYLDNVTKHVDNGLPIDTLYLDFAKAFDKVPHRRLLMKLKAHAIDGVVLEWIRRWFTDGSKRHSLQAGELSQWTQAAVQIVSNLPAPSNGSPIYRFWGMPAMWTRWMDGVAAHKSG